VEVACEVHKPGVVVRVLIGVSKNEQNKFNCEELIFVYLFTVSDVCVHYMVGYGVGRDQRG
jgi:hypothetical protein